MRSVDDWITLLVVVGFWILLWKLDRDGHRNTDMDLATGDFVGAAEKRAADKDDVAEAGGSAT